MFFGEKLQSVRELNGLSRKELADKLSLSEQAIWQYENQYTVPKFEVVNELKKVFNVKAQFFYTESFVTNISKVESIAYRAEDREARKKTKMETTFIDFTSYFLDKFESKLNLQASLLSQLRNESIQLYNTSTEASDRLLQLEIIAENAREKLDVQSNSELLYKLELSGIYILEKSMGVSIDAYSTWTSQEKPFIILGNKKKSAVRRNFDLAHELGHLLLHYKIDMDSLTKDEHKIIEKEANDFASFFLLPKNQFLKDFLTISKKSNPESYLDLKMKYMVSIGALEYRAYKMGLLTFEENRYFYAALNRKGYKKNEPLDEDISIIRPGKVRSLLDLIFKNHLFSLNDILNDCYIERSFLESLLGIENEFLSKYSEESNREYFNNSNVVSLFTKETN
ncbi:helix-turn-helix domain-containing protein [Listeria ivanovii]|uniref:XRE family transcriptional regulator n=2 Tax=Listeria ivanovii TaxID=1638 RepID=A0ABS1G3W1_LISIV|nr:XRE family transcriptional regulator [Listeria ivanovii]AIS59224.1 transcriptional regulator [Listeria ivanovii subsp. londoniensis]AIS62059.1 transcriptional regulator [Listeria ivanovii subsp. londoniensis]MBK1961562.1 XRE family transcriptional regulator [Listeria ivanovii subsp. londoniensis]MBK1965572.1 XRE family transcriptional regulator [Listeria ivanovii subsp. londoniensis]MBK1983397.1 XRE family transcriptional regulator [Listeria ivanovii subsp. londoniensis]